MFGPLINHWESEGNFEICEALVKLETAFAKYYEFSSIKDFSKAGPLFPPMKAAENAVRTLIDTVK